jgi:hypothetical protein
MKSIDEDGQILRLLNILDALVMRLALPIATGGKAFGVLSYKEGPAPEKPTSYATLFKRFQFTATPLN